MKKRTILILIIISTIISLVFTIGNYYGIDRYIRMRLIGSDSLIEAYSKLPLADKEQKTVVSLSATQKDFTKLRPVLNSLLDQTVRVDKITLVIPSQYEREDLPDFVTKIANTQPAGKDYGEGMKLIPALLKEKESDTTIIALDNNWVYGKDFIETMIKSMKQHKGEVLIDSKDTCMLLKPEYFDSDVIDRDNSIFDKKWFLAKAKKSKVIPYTENYSVF